MPKRPDSKSVATASAGVAVKNASLFLNVLPRRLRRTLPYAETFVLTTGTAGVLSTEQAMRLNSLYDPNYTGAGHQPYGFDQLVGFYGSYLVHAVKVKIMACSVGGSAEVAICWKLDVSQGFSAISGITVDAATEAPMIGVGLLGASGNDRTFVKDLSIDMFKLFGVTKSQYTNEVSTYGAAYGANPTAVAYLHLAVGSYTGTAGENASVQVLIEYDTEFFSPNELAQS